MGAGLLFTKPGSPMAKWGDRNLKRPYTGRRPERVTLHGRPIPDHARADFNAKRHHGSVGFMDHTGFREFGNFEQRQIFAGT